MLYFISAIKNDVSVSSTLRISNKYLELEAPPSKT
jgi:hypothetical protein